MCVAASSSVEDPPPLPSAEPVPLLSPFLLPAVGQKKGGKQRGKRLSGDCHCSLWPGIPSGKG